MSKYAGVSITGLITMGCISTVPFLGSAAITGNCARFLWGVLTFAGILIAVKDKEEG